jgi:hypothetical protein
LAPLGNNVHFVTAIDGSANQRNDIAISTVFEVAGGEAMIEFERAKLLSLKAHSELDEKWIQDLIANDPSILGLGDLELRQKERIQPRTGRLDLLLQDADGRRYEVELQLGSTDETHIIRTIEYWDSSVNATPSMTTAPSSLPRRLPVGS